MYIKKFVWKFYQCNLLLQLVCGDNFGSTLPLTVRWCSASELSDWAGSQVCCFLKNSAEMSHPELSQPACATCVKLNEITAGTDVAAGGNLNPGSWLLLMLYFPFTKKPLLEQCQPSGWLWKRKLSKVCQRNCSSEEANPNHDHDVQKLYMNVSTQRVVTLLGQWDVLQVTIAL